MRYQLKHPCKECPFRAASLRGYLGPLTGKPEQFVNPVAGRVEIQPGVFVGGEPADIECHMDHDRALRELGSDNSEDLNPDDLQHCAGALLFLVRDHKLPHDREKVDAMERLEKRNDCRAILGNVREFIAHHTLGRRSTKKPSTAARR